MCRWCIELQVYGAEGLTLRSLDLIRNLCYTGKPTVAICLYPFRSESRVIVYRKFLNDCASEKLTILPFRRSLNRSMTALCGVRRRPSQAPDCYAIASNSPACETKTVYWTSEGQEQRLLWAGEMVLDDLLHFTWIFRYTFVLTVRACYFGNVSVSRLSQESPIDLAAEGGPIPSC